MRLNPICTCARDLGTRLDSTHMYLSLGVRLDPMCICAWDLGARLDPAYMYLCLGLRLDPTTKLYMSGWEVRSHIKFICVRA